MTITLGQLKGHARLAVGGSPSTASGVTVDQRLIEIVNAAGDPLFPRQWRFRERTAGGFDLTKDQDFISLATDGSGATINVGEIMSIKSSNTLSFTIDLVAPAAFEEFKRSNAKTSLFYVATLTRTPQTDSGLPTPRLDLFPTPSSTTDDAVFVRYRESWPAWTTATADTVTAPVPGYCDQLVIEYVRAIAEGGEDGSTHQRLAMIDQGTLLDQALRKDGVSTNDLGVLPMARGFFLDDTGGANLGISQPGVNTGYNLVWRGQWSGSTSYVQDDLVRDGGSVYIAIADSTNVAPGDTTKWDLFIAGTADQTSTLRSLSDVTGTYPVTSNTLLTFNINTGQAEWKSNFLTAQPLGNLSNVSSSSAATNNALVWSGSQWQPTSLASGTLSDVDTASPSNGNVLVYNSTSSKYVPTAQEYRNRPHPSKGEVAVNWKAYVAGSGASEAASYKPVYVRSFYQAQNSSGPEGIATLQTSSGIHTLVASEGYLINDLNNAIMPGYYGRVELWSNGSLVLSRAGDYSNADDGYYITVYYTKTADSAGTE